MTGELSLITGEGLSVRFSVNEKVSRLDDDCIKTNSNSYHHGDTSEGETISILKIGGFKPPPKKSNNKSDLNGTDSTNDDIVEIIKISKPKRSKKHKSVDKSLKQLKLTGISSSHTKDDQCAKKQEKTYNAFADLKNFLGEFTFAAIISIFV